MRILGVFVSAVLVFGASPVLYAEAEDRREYRQVSLFTTSTERARLDVLRKRYLNSGELHTAVKENFRQQEKKPKGSSLVFKGIIKRGSSSEPELLIQSEGQRWLSKSEWQQLVESDDAGVRVKKGTRTVLLKPGQSLR